MVVRITTSFFSTIVCKRLSHTRTIVSPKFIANDVHGKIPHFFHQTCEQTRAKSIFDTTMYIITLRSRNFSRSKGSLSVHGSDAITRVKATLTIDRSLNADKKISTLFIARNWRVGADSGPIHIMHINNRSRIEGKGMPLRSSVRERPEAVRRPVLFFIISIMMIIVIMIVGNRRSTKLTPID